MATDRAAFVTRLTGEGVGAIAVVRVWGSGAVEVASAAFRPRSGVTLAESPAGRLRLGHVGAGIGDEVVALLVEADEDGGPAEVEVQCHGGPAAVELVVEGLEAEGAVRRPRWAWLGRGGASAVGIAAQYDLSRATTLRTAAILNDQAAGALEGELRRILELIELGRGEAALGLIKALLERSVMGTRLIDGWTIALAGRPNVGKSALMNALAGFDRAIVSSTPGTTRDVLTVRTALAGWPVELADMAGVREASDPIEAAGVARARERQARADVVLLVLDRSEPLRDEDRALIGRHSGGIVAANKSDLSASWLPAEVLRGWDFVEVSAERGDGLDRLARTLATRLTPEAPAAGVGVPWRETQVRRLARAAGLLAAGKSEAAGRVIEPMVRARTGV